MSNPTKQDAIKLLDVFDPEMATLLHREEKRQFETIGLIASENVVSPMASCLEGSAFTNKNTEGYAGKRFVGGCQLADQAELLAVQGSPVDIGGYYRPHAALTDAAMRPSTTLNAVIEALA